MCKRKQQDVYFKTGCGGVYRKHLFGAESYVVYIYIDADITNFIPRAVIKVCNYGWVVRWYK